MSRLMTQTTLLVNLLVVLLFLLADSARVVSPDRLLLPSYLGLAFPLIAAFNFAFLFWWILRRRWYALFSLVSIIVCLESVWETFPLNLGDGAQRRDGHSIKVLTYNVHLFDFYKKKSQNMVLDYLKNSGADILCIQEYGFFKKSDYLEEGEIEDVLREFYPYSHTHFGNVNSIRTFGVATYSKYPIVSRRKIEYESQHNSSILTEISVDGRVINVVNCHLESNKITENDKELIKRLRENLDNETARSTAEQLSKKLGASYQLRASQAQAVSRIVENSKDPVILCGDFNDVAVSYAYNTIKGSKLSSAFAENGCGYGFTFGERMFPFRIDHILYSKEFESYEFKIDKVPYSDHYPVMCRFILDE